MSDKAKSLVFGYVRNNYRLHVPEMIIKIILLFFDQETIIKFKGKVFQKFLESPVRHSFKTTMKFNQNLSFIFEIYPNGPTTESKGHVGVTLHAANMNDVNYYAICHEISCIETQSSFISFHRIGKENNYRAIGNSLWLKLSQCKEQKELTFKVIIRSLEIKYKDDENKKGQLFYPSLTARLLKQETSLNWTVDGKRLRECWKNQRISSQLKDNWNFAICPNSSYREGMLVLAQLRSWPLNISKMIFMIKSKIVIDAKIDNDEWQCEFTLNDYNGNCLNAAILDGEIIELEQIKNMTFDVTIIIKQLYDLNDVEIPVEKWRNHNVQI